MPIFLSHKQEDGEKARKIHEYLTDNQVSCYLDCLDEAVSSQKNITEYLIKKIDECSHLMVVVSQDNTRKSWWIPFEIGIATEKKREFFHIILVKICKVTIHSCLDLMSKK